jgi:hypothetical protein
MDTEARRKQRQEVSRAVGYKHKANGTGIFAMTDEQRQEVSRRNARSLVENKKGIHAPDYDRSKAALINVRNLKENGDGIFAPGMAEEGGRIAGRKTKENGTGIFAPENIGKGGRIGGRIGVQTQQRESIGIFGLTPEETEKNSALGGSKSYKESVGVHAPENIGIGCHVRWHVNRGIVNPLCGFCLEEAS